MSRPSQLLLVAGVYLFGATVGVETGAAGFRVERLGWGLAVLLAAAASVHYANEYADVETDRLATRTPFSGGSGALPRTGLPPTVALAAAVVTGALGVGGLALAWVSAVLPVAAVVVLGVIAVLGWQYSLPPLALAWNGLGEVDNALLGGLLLPTYGLLVQRGTVPPSLVLVFVPFAILVFVNLLATTWPDREADAAVGKHTLATRWSRRRLRGAYAGAAGACFVAVAVLAGVGRLPVPVGAASLLVLPVLVWGGDVYTRQRSPVPTVAAMVGLVVVQGAAWLLA
jgi:1,4-dihydroxy-2-naphthoate octaprenyltransferase